MGNSTRAAEDVREEVGTPSLTSASLFDGLVPPTFPPIAASRGSPFFGIITIPISIQSNRDGDDSFCGGSHVRQTWEGRHLDPPERRLDKPEAPVEERHTGSFLILLRFLRSCMRLMCVHTWYSDSGGDLQDSQPHKGFSPK